jgi:hypothetical protein
MNFENISQACLLVFDTLRNDAESADIIKQIDTAETDEAIKDGLVKAVKRLDKVNPSVARIVREKTKDFAF